MQILCLPCSGIPSNELECTHCLNTKKLSEFAKVYRRDRDNAVSCLPIPFEQSLTAEDLPEMRGAECLGSFH
jgi:hypothetical protein